MVSQTIYCAHSTQSLNNAPVFKKVFQIALYICWRLALECRTIFISHDQKVGQQYLNTEVNF